MMDGTRYWRRWLRFAGALLVALAVQTLLSDLHITGSGLDYRPEALGQAWHGFHRPSLNLVQAIVERYVLPQLWGYLLLPLLLQPAWLVAAGAGALLIALSYWRIADHKADSPSR